MIHVVGAALFRNGKLLACRRARDKNLSGFWEFPGGKVEKGESAKQALQRELREELNVEAIIHNQLTSVHEPEGQIQLDVYLVETNELPLLSSSHDQHLWVSVSKLHELNWAPLDLPTVSFLSKKESLHLWGDQ